MVPSHVGAGPSSAAHGRQKKNKSIFRLLQIIVFQFRFTRSVCTRKSEKKKSMRLAGPPADKIDRMLAAENEFTDDTRVSSRWRC